ncbi:MAG: hypothetical protein WD490_08215 [Opitutales bacterium]
MQVLPVGEWLAALNLWLEELGPLGIVLFIFAYGLTAIRFWPYVAASWIGMLPGTLLYVYLGAAGRVGLEAAAAGEVERDPLELVFLGVGLVATVVVTVYVTKIARRALKEAEPEVGE